MGFLKPSIIKQNLEKFIADFEAVTGYGLEIRDGSPYYNGNLDLRGTDITSLPDGFVVDGSLYLENCTGITSLPDGLAVGGSLYMRDTGITSLPDGLTVGGTIDLENCTGITSLPDDLIVGGDLYLHNSGITSLPEGLTVGRYLDLSGTDITSLPDGLTVGSTIDLKDCVGITSLPEGLTVGGSLLLSGTGITSLPESLTVGGDLDLRGTDITSLPKGLTVGESIYLRDTGITDTSNVTWTLSAKDRKKISDAQNRPITWKRDGMEYIKVDRIFTAVDSHHGNVYRVHKLGCEKQLYLVTDGNNHWAHGDTLQEARVDLIYKINDRDTSMYDGMTLDGTLTFEEAIIAYRTITGACSPGTRDYINNRLLKPHKAKYTIREIISLTEGEYGSERFMKFFKQMI